MTEEQIERRVEGLMNALDHLFLTTDMTQKEYDARIKEIDTWASSSTTLQQHKEI